MYTLHILLLPGIMLALIAVHLGLVWYQKHTQLPGVRRKESNVVGVRIVPVFAAKSTALALIVFAVLLAMSGLFQINPIWEYGPYRTAMVSAGSQPDWYLAWADGLLRLWPPWALFLGDYTVPTVFFSAVLGMGITFCVLLAYPWLERRLSGDRAHHNLLQRPRDVPVRTSLGAMMVTYFLVIEASGFNDIIAFLSQISLNATVWAGRIGVLLLPPLVYYVTYRVCLGLRRSDRAVLEHGLETGVIKRLPHGAFIDVHQPLAAGGDGHAKRLEYQGTPVPKKLNKLGIPGRPMPGGLLRPDPTEETKALERAREREEGEQR